MLATLANVRMDFTAVVVPTMIATVEKNVRSQFTKRTAKEENISATTQLAIITITPMTVNVKLFAHAVRDAM